MSVFLVVALALFLDRLLGDPSSYHPLRGFSRFAILIEDNWHRNVVPFLPEHLRPPEEEPLTPEAIKVIDTTEKVKGTLAVLFLVLPFVALADILSKHLVSPLDFVFNVLVMYFVIGAHNLKQHAIDVRNALASENIELAKKEVSIMINYDTQAMNKPGVIAACLEAIFEHGNDTIIAPIFWFVVLGAPGAVLYRLVNILDTMWGYQSLRYKNFGWAATKINIVLNWVPARLAAFTYMLLGNVKNAWLAFNEQAKTWNSPNDELVAATGAGALGIQIGGDVYCHGELKKRAALGSGRLPDLEDIGRANDLTERAMIVWLVFTLILSLLH